MEYLILGNGAGMAEYSTPLCLAYNNCRGMAARICVTQIVQPIQ